MRRRRVQQRLRRRARPPRSPRRPRRAAPRSARSPRAVNTGCRAYDIPGGGASAGRPGSRGEVTSRTIRAVSVSRSCRLEPGLRGGDVNDRVGARLAEHAPPPRGSPVEAEQRELQRPVPRIDRHVVLGQRPRSAPSAGPARRGAARRRAAAAASSSVTPSGIAARGTRRLRSNPRAPPWWARPACRPGATDRQLCSSAPAAGVLRVRRDQPNAAADLFGGRPAAAAGSPCGARSRCAQTSLRISVLTTVARSTGSGVPGLAARLRSAAVLRRSSTIAGHPILSDASCHRRTRRPRARLGNRPGREGRPPRWRRRCKTACTHDRHSLMRAVTRGGPPTHRRRGSTMRSPPPPGGRSASPARPPAPRRAGGGPGSPSTSESSCAHHCSSAWSRSGSPPTRRVVGRGTLTWSAAGLVDRVRVVALEPQLLRVRQRQRAEPDVLALHARRRSARTRGPAAGTGPPRPGWRPAPAARRTGRSSRRPPRRSRSSSRASASLRYISRRSRSTPM